MKGFIMKVLDISMEISERMVSYPSDRKFVITKVLELIKGDPVNLSEISMNVHTGTHLDVPKHYISNSASITDINPDKFFGNAKVFDFTKIKMGTGITEVDLKILDIKKDEIILFKTKNSEISGTNFKENYVHLTQEGAAYLASKKIKSVGIDYLSIGKYKEDKKTHITLLENNILIYEGLNLKEIQAGEYLFCGFPLKIKESEGAPVRAVLLEK
jgi:arylformamidase